MKSVDEAITGRVLKKLSEIELWEHITMLKVNV